MPLGQGVAITIGAAAYGLCLLALPARRSQAGWR